MTPGDIGTQLSSNSSSTCHIETLKNLKGFRLGHLNINSLTKYIDQLNIYLRNEPLDIFSLNETRLDESISDINVNIKGYDIVRNDRNREGGGVAIYYRNHLNVKIRSDLLPDDIEAICIEVTGQKTKPLLVASVYRPPNSRVEFLNKFENFVQNIDKEDKEFMLLGDMNCDLLPEIKSSSAKRFLDIINLYQLQQLITKPTRITDNSETLIDVILTNKQEKILESGVIHLGISDHSFIYACRKVAIIKSQPKIIETRNFKCYNPVYFEADLNEALMSNIWVSDDPNVNWEVFKETFNYIAEIHAPIRIRRVRSQYTPWLNEYIIKQMKHRDFLKKKAVKTKSVIYQRAYKEARNHVNKAIMKAKKDYYHNNIDKNRGNLKTMWKHLNHLTGRCSKTTNIAAVKDGNETLYQDGKIAEAFNDYFINIGQKLSNNIPHTNQGFEQYLTPTPNEFVFTDITQCEVLLAINTLRTSKASGPDKIPTGLLKDCKEVITPYLTHIFNQSLTLGTFPDDWKNARVSPIYKSGSKDECGNYRPISILSVVSKLFEKLVYNQLNNYLNENNILSEYQSGFRKGYSTSASLLNTTNTWYLNMDSGLLNGVLFLDLRKAFDTVNHEVLIKKLYLYGIKGKALAWFSSYLENRKQFCKINQSVSQSRTIECGVPQGSNLGPLLFLLYINDLPNCLEHSHPAMYADDTNITVSGKTTKDLEINLNNELEKVHVWLTVNKLTLNIKKTEYMVIGSYQRLSQVTYDPEIIIGNDKIKRVSSTKSLGIVIDEKLKWDAEIDNISKKVSKTIGMIKKVKPFVDKDSLKCIYQTLILPHFDYCAMVWGNCSKTLQEKLQKLQNRAGRVITGDDYEVRSEEVLNKLGWEPLHKRRMSKITSYMENVIKKQCPELISNMFTLARREMYNLRSNDLMLMLSKPNTNAMKRSFSYAAAKAWNCLPKDRKLISLSHNK